MDTTFARAATAPATAGERQERKQRVLTQGIPSITRTIADAIVLKDGDLFLITDADGQIPHDRDHGLGLYYHDCRFLHTYEMRIDGTLPVLLGAGAGAGYRGSVQLTNPELDAPKGTGIPRDALGIEWHRTLDGQTLTLTDVITLRNWSHAAVTFALDLRFEAGFEDVFEVRGLLGERPGRQASPEWSEHALRLTYRGGDDVDRTIWIAVPEDLERIEDTVVGATIRLEPRAHRTLHLQLTVQETDRAAASSRPAAPDPAACRFQPRECGEPAHTRPADPWPGGMTAVTTDSLALNAILTRSFADLQLLRSTLRGHTFIAAGIPWFATLFGRDSLIASLQLLAYAPTVAVDTLRLLATYQGTRDDHWRDEAPGKILHELRLGEMASLGEIPHTPYYGTVDATPLLIIVLARYVNWTGDLALFDELRDHVARALAWIDDAGDQDGDGYVEYQSTSEHGLINQGWKDSGDAIVDQQGQIARPPIALAEVQAYVYEAKLAAADLYARHGDDATADRLRQEAATLRTRFNQDFWVESLDFYAMALEGKKQPLRVVSSNPGHALWCGIADAGKVARVAKRLMADDMFSGWGIRTLSARERGYTPIGYHLGTVWPHDSALIAAGLKRYGFASHARRVFDGLAEAAMRFEHDRLPELFTGFARRDYGVPIRYPVACHPQAWAAGSLPFLLEHLLGLEPSALDHTLRIVHPVLPSFVNSLELDGLRVGDAAVRLRFERSTSGVDDTVSVQVLSVEGDLDVRIEGTPDDMETRS